MGIAKGHHELPSMEDVVVSESDVLSGVDESGIIRQDSHILVWDTRFNGWVTYRIVPGGLVRLKVS